MTFGGRRDAAGLRPSEPTGPVARDKVVNYVPDSRGYYAEDGRQRKRQAKQHQHPKHSVGAEPRLPVFDQNNRPDALLREARLAGEDGSGCGLAGGEAEDVFLVEAKQKVDPAIAEGAFAIEDYDSMGIWFHA